jgi:preprotein translocase subunit SecY
MLGGMIIGLLTVIGDLLDVIGSSTGILISANILYGFYDQLSHQSKVKSVSFY